MTGRTLPLIVSVTGHRDLRADDVPALTVAVRGIFEQFRSKYPSTPLVLLTALASGADQLVARVAKSMGIAYRVPMPLPELEYRKDFKDADAAAFDELLAAAEERYFVGFVGDNAAGNVGDPDRRARQYAEAGAYMARISHVLIALWNGKPTDAGRRASSSTAWMGRRNRIAPRSACSTRRIPDRSIRSSHRANPTR